MNCIEFEENIAGYAGEELDPDALASVEQHLQICTACAELAGALASDRDLLSGQPPDLADADYAVMRSAVRRGVVRERRIKRFASVLLLAASLLAVVVIATQGSGRPPVKTSKASWGFAQITPPLTPAAPSVRNPESPRTVARVHRVPRKPRSISPPVPSPPDPHDPAALAAALDELNGPSDVHIAKGSTSPIEMRIATSDPSIVIIWLQQTKEGSDD